MSSGVSSALEESSMRAYTKGLVLALCLSSLPALARQVWIGRLTSSGASVNQTTTAVPFTIPGAPAFGIKLSFQCQDGNAYVRSGKGPSLAVVAPPGATAGVYLAQFNLFDEPLDTISDSVAMISVTGTVNCDVYLVTP